MVIDTNSAQILAEDILVAIEEFSRHLVVSKPKRIQAAEMSAEAGMDESQLYFEWTNEVVDDWVPSLGAQPNSGDETSDQASMWRTAYRDADQSYVDWLKLRLQDRYRVSGYIVKKAVRRFGVKPTVRMAFNTWPQEIAWAQRLRRSEDPVTAGVAELFLLQAARDPSKEFLKLLKVYVETAQSLDYLRAMEHEFTASQIRNGVGSPDFKPLVLRYAELELKPKIADLSQPEILALAAHARSQEEKELADHVRMRAINALHDVHLCRLTGIINVAIRSGLDSNSVVKAQRTFLEAVKAGKVKLSVDTGIPYAEFVEWLRLKAPIVRENRATFDQRRGAFLNMSSRWRSWVSQLPLEYIEMGGSNEKTLEAWMAPYVYKQKPYPEDLISDYGFFLVEGEFVA